MISKIWAFHRERVLSLVLLGMFLCSCSSGDELGDRPVARAYDEELLWSDLRHVIPFDITPEDSSALTQQFVRNWMRQRAVLHQAELNLAASAKDFEAQLLDYRNSLVIYTYEQALVQQKLDTSVHVREMEEYHTRNAANFELRDAVYRVRWAKVREDDKRVVKRFEQDFLSGGTERMHELEMWLAQRGLGFFDRSRNWINEQELRMDLAMARPAELKINTSAGRQVHREGPTLFFLEILEFRNVGEIAPIELVQDDIRSIVVNQRKLQLLERMREDLYLEALELQHLEIF